MQTLILEIDKHILNLCKEIEVKYNLSNIFKLWINVKYDYELETYFRIINNTIYYCDKDGVPYAFEKKDVLYPF
ncbi:hypothetical protein AGMMS49579_01530 [Spirochaetia bacterium]|nr:hypothetical protein AGMMS49579_01530 [Spirochaetia bacterium]